MTSLTNFQEIPVVDVSGLYGSSEQRRAVADALGRAAREVGFLYVTGSGVSQELFDDLLAVTKDFFALPLEEKLKVYIGNSTNHRGYVPTGEEGGGINADQGADRPLPEQDDQMRVVALNNDRDQYSVVLQKRAEDMIVDRHESNGQLFNALGRLTVEQTSTRPAHLRSPSTPTGTSWPSGCA